MLAALVALIVSIIGTPLDMSAVRRRRGPCSGPLISTLSPCRRGWRAEAGQYLERAVRTRAGGGASPPGPVGRGTWADDARAENGQKMSGLRGSYVSMENSRFLKCLAADYDLLREAAAAAGPGAAVPSCPARTWHEPDQTVSFWIRRMAQETVIHRIDAQLAAGVPPAPVPEDLAVDGVDEVLRLFLAYGSQVWPEEFAQVEDHLATADGKDRITVIAGQAAWTVRPSPPQVIVDGGADDGAVAVIDAAPDAMLRWLWGRAADGEIVVTG